MQLILNFTAYFIEKQTNLKYVEKNYTVTQKMTKISYIKLFANSDFAKFDDYHSKF